MPVIVHRHGPITVLLPPAARNVDAVDQDDMALRHDDARPAAELDVAGDRFAMDHHTSLYRRLRLERRRKQAQRQDGDITPSALHSGLARVGERRATTRAVCQLLSVDVTTVQKILVSFVDASYFTV